MKLYVFTKKDIDRFLIECNFTPDEERLFRLRCKEYTLEYCAEQMNVSEHIYGEEIKQKSKQ